MLVLFDLPYTTSDPRRTCHRAYVVIEANAVHIFSLLQARVGHAAFQSDVVPEDWAPAHSSDIWRKRIVVVTSCNPDIFADIYIGSHALASKKRKEEAGRMCTDGWNSACLPTSSPRVPPSFIHRSFVPLLNFFDIHRHCMLLRALLLNLS